MGKRIYCLFCGRSQRDVEYIVQAEDHPTATICNICVDTANKLVHINNFEERDSEWYLWKDYAP